MAIPTPVMDRVITDFPPPPYFTLPHNEVFKGAKLDWKVLKEHFTKEGRITKADALKIISTAAQLLKSEPTLIMLQDPITVVGDIHGQYYDFLKILELGGNPERTQYLFLGDYVDRGTFSIEVILLLYALKINYPSLINMLRGNHECRQMTSMFSFRTECIYKYDLEVYNAFMDSFDCLPMACILNNSFLAVHGGLSPDLNTLNDIKNMKRFVEPGRDGLQCDLLWSDPIDIADGRLPEVYRNNEVRGCSYFFGGEATRKFLKDNDLVSVIRAHEAQKDGYKMIYWNGADFPSTITIFSAPNYCDCYKNKGAVIKFDEGTLNIQQYNFSKHPYLLPDFMDVFTWSVPFVIEKVIQMLYLMIKREGFSSKISIDEACIGRIIELEQGVASSDLRQDIIEKILIMLRKLRDSKDKEVSEPTINEKPIPKPRKSLTEAPVLTDDNETFFTAMINDRVNEKRPLGL
ncbi:hypothetical protein SteCoe_22554 [Stentor coeruleus]|uniref:Serine/threonine-protein phosphatase n=1 Tax=Stentor coeruleus TaxID=5963 RepID=A0A1R2BM06_9CILI|nr:hypothetical protein SteCoe_22554 [Stentor coeruleus]